DLADMRNAERIDEAVELDLAPRLDGGEQLRRGRLAPPFPRLEFRRGTAVAAGKRGDVLRWLDETIVVEGLDVLLAKPLDVEGVARHEMLEPFDPLRRADQSAGATPDGIFLAGNGIDFPHGMTAAGGADRGKAESFCALGALRFDHAENLRN